jgi:hypothetical protein
VRWTVNENSEKSAAYAMARKGVLSKEIFVRIINDHVDLAG